MVFVVFLLAYLIRRQLDSRNRLDGDVLWRAWFHRGAKIQAGKEDAITSGLIWVLLPGLFAGMVWIQAGGLSAGADRAGVADGRAGLAASVT